MLALVGAGCGGGGGHKSGNAYGDAYVYLDWNLYDVGDTVMASSLACAAVGAGDIVLTMVDTANPQLIYEDTFPCATSNFTGTSEYVPSGTYSITVSLYGDAAKYGNSTILLDQLTSTMTLVSGPNNLGVIDFMVNSFVLGWVVTDGGLTSSCQAVGGSYIALDVYFSGQTQPTTYYLNCSGYNPAATSAIPMGTYNVQWQAFVVDAYYQDLSLGTSMASYTVQTGVQADLGTVYFAF